MSSSLRAAVRAPVWLRFGTGEFLLGFALTERTARETIVKPRPLAVLGGTIDLKLRQRGHVFATPLLNYQLAGSAVDL
jgi:hypothetical protein